MRQNACDDDGQRGQRQVWLNGALRAETPVRAGAAAGLHVVQAIGGEGAGGTHVAGAVDCVATGAAARATIMCAERPG